MPNKASKKMFSPAKEVRQVLPPVMRWKCARSKNIRPWENAPFNPLLRTESRNEKWWSKGYGSIVDTEDGRLFMIFHAYENGFRDIGASDPFT